MIIFYHSQITPTYCACEKKAVILHRNLVIIVLPLLKNKQLLINIKQV